jgi:NAD(P)-dependent dehydrogenase (short-subunit alcohol dehydrogenase family)
MSSRQLNHKVALISGGGSGIGRACALLLAKEGARIGLIDVKQEAAKETERLIRAQGGEAIALAADISKHDQVEAAVAKVQDQWKRLDILVANAGINGILAPLEDIMPEEWDRTIDVNLRGTFLQFKYSIPLLKKSGGSAIITSSMQGNRVFTSAGTTAYACTKAAQVAFAKKAALELARYNIRVNVICPGSTDTDINSSSISRNTVDIKYNIEFHDGKIPLTGGKKVSPEQTAELVLFLASDRSYPITGTEIFIDGGMSLLMG